MTETKRETIMMIGAGVGGRGFVKNDGGIKSVKLGTMYEISGREVEEGMRRSSKIDMCSTMYSTEYGSSRRS